MDQNNNSKRKTGPLAALGAAAIGAKVLLKGGLLLKFGWLLKSGLSMFVFLGLYTVVYGWRFAMIAVALLLLHELGHWVWMKANGLPADGPIFLPFVGAYVRMNALPEDEATRAWIAYAGPLIGGAGGLAFWMLGLLTNNGLLMAAGNFGFLLNLLQLIPARPLDGGFILRAVSKWLLIPGTAIIIALAIIAQSPLLFLISIIAIVSLFRKFRPTPKPVAVPLGNAGEGAPPTVNIVDNPKPATTGQRWAIGLAYVFLVGFLGYMHGYSLAVMKVQLHMHSPSSYMMDKDQ